MPDIVSIGECFIELFTREHLHIDARWDRLYSGDTLNVVAMAAGLGSSCGYITRVSDDPMGDFLLSAWRDAGIDTTCARQVRGFNAFQFASSEPQGDGTKVVYRTGSAASTMTVDDLDDDYLAGARILHVSGITQGLSATCRQTVLVAVQKAAAAGVTVSYDTNLRPHLWSVEEAREAMAEVLPCVDLIAPSFPGESRALTGLDSEADVIAHFLDLGVDVVMLKCGDAGAWVGTSQRLARIPAVAPRGLVHSMGAGDTFVGGALHCLARGMDPVEAARWGVACAGLKVGGPSIAALPTRREVEELVETVAATEV